MNVFCPLGHGGKGTGVEPRRTVWEFKITITNDKLQNSSWTWKRKQNPDDNNAEYISWPVNIFTSHWYFGLLNKLFTWARKEVKCKSFEINIVWKRNNDKFAIFRESHISCVESKKVCLPWYLVYKIKRAGEMSWVVTFTTAKGNTT